MRISDWSSDVCSSDLQHDDLSEIDRVQRVGDRQFLQLVLHLGALAHPGGVEKLDRMDLAVAFPLPVDADRIARDPGLRPCNQRSEEHTSELQSLMRISYAVFCLKKKKKKDDKPDEVGHKQDNQIIKQSR